MHEKLQSLQPAERKKMGKEVSSDTFSLIAIELKLSLHFRAVHMSKNPSWHRYMLG